LAQIACGNFRRHHTPTAGKKRGFCPLLLMTATSTPEEVLDAKSGSPSAQADH
jgi:hypothetical protein